jgi:A/G-specific adenine glycosylase
VKELRAGLLAWFAREKRDLPWRSTRDPYKIWLSEVMLQQTRVDTVIPYYEAFTARFPTVLKLAEASEDEVLSAWSGLGYYRRARLLHQGAKTIAGLPSFPDTAEALREVPGIGEYTAGAVASIGFGEQAPLVDGNVHRVLSRIFSVDKPAKETRKQVWKIAADLVVGKQPGDLNQSLMELGATVCTPQKPRCLLCPVSHLCLAKAKGLEHTLPLSDKKTAVKNVESTALVLTRGAPKKLEVLLGRRPAEGLFGGLWEPPRQEGSARLFGVDWSLREAVGQVEHVLTHRKMQVRVVSMHVSASNTSGKALKELFSLGASPEEAPAGSGYEVLAWAKLPLDAKKRGISTLAKKVLAAAQL